MASYQSSNIFNHLVQNTASQGLGLDNDLDNDSDSGSNASSTGPFTHQAYPWSNYSLPQLRDLLRQRGQLTTGSKSALKKRLKNLDRAAKSSALSSIGAPVTTVIGTTGGAPGITGTTTIGATLSGQPTAATSVHQTSNTTIHISSSPSSQQQHPRTPSSNTRDDGTNKGENSIGDSNGSGKKAHPLRSRMASRSNSFSAHFSGTFEGSGLYLRSKKTSRWRRIALETERQEISVYTSPLTVLSYFFLYLLHEFRMVVLWIVSQQYLLIVLPLLTAAVYLIYQTDGAHQPLLKHAESGLIWYGYWILLGVASSIGLGCGLHSFVLFLGPHIANVTLTAYKCGNTQFDVRGDHRFICQAPDEPVPLTLTLIFGAVALESFFWGMGTAFGELPPYFVARAAALSGNRNEELASIEDLLKKKPDSVSYKERILLMVHEGMKRLGFFGIFLCASIPNPLFDLAGITCGHFLIPFSTFFGATFLGKAVVKSSIQAVFVILMFSADTLAVSMSWLERQVPFIHGYLADGINSQKGALSGAGGQVSDDELENSTSLVGLIWNTILFIMISYFLLSIVETMALSQIKRRHDQEIVELEGKIRSGDTNALFVAVSEELVKSTKANTTTTTTTNTTTTNTETACISTSSSNGSLTSLASPHSATSAGTSL
ncbi:Vacuolar membrane protease [Linnemannia gamsii]|uniref:Vacuolar membrane protease n=1 Tax=Linnemannia gamsii TaxID=64522 RepID=A0A9P6R7G7_9FUNG|nr:Vacuolar membrane protease [Linnemannia gamsii]